MENGVILSGASAESKDLLTTSVRNLPNGRKSYQCALRSFHSGFILSIKRFFFARVHPLSCFSREMAL